MPRLRTTLIQIVHLVEKIYATPLYTHNDRKVIAREQQQYPKIQENSAAKQAKHTSEGSYNS
jgi:hypothetical protein